MRCAGTGKIVYTCQERNENRYMLQDFELEKMVEPLLLWYVKNARTLPWREDATPYRVWISEIMLQQTRVEAVKPYFARFIKRLPDVAALASCPEDELLKLWEGLGYYNRVRNMKEAAIQVMEHHDGRLPADYEELLQLKGIGHYTAGAIASIAYGIGAPAVDGNVLRILTRLTGDDTDIMKQSFRNSVEQALFALYAAILEEPGRLLSEECLDALPGKNIPGTLNQALMELGATVCVPNGAPCCEKCPWQEMCTARLSNRIEELPVKSKAKARRIEERTVFILRDGERVAIRKRPKKGLLAGLYELPNVEGHLTQDEVLAAVKQMGFSPIRIQPLADAKHIFSHIEWQMKGYAILVEEKEEPADILLVEAEDAMRRYAIPSAFVAYAQYVNIKLGKEGNMLLSGEQET